MFTRLVEFGEALREAGIPVAPSDTADALRALTSIPIDRRDAVRSALGATLIKRQSHLAAFDTLFDIYFGDREPESEGEPDALQPEPDEISNELFDAIAGGDEARMGEIVSQAVALFGRLGRSPDWYSNYEVKRAIRLDDLEARLKELAADPELSELDRRLLLDEFDRRVRWVRDAILRETRMRTARIRDPDYVARYVVDSVPEEMNFFSAMTDAAELRRAVRPLARKLATRVAMKRRRASKGHIDMRRTMRHSLSTGGVPIDTPFKHRTPHRPELLLLCDVSSSVARFSRFTLMLTHALRSQFQKVRAYAFVNTLADITAELEVEDFAEAVGSIGDRAAVDSYDGRTDYGAIFRELADTHSDAYGPKTTVLILGDARSNYRARNVDRLKLVRKQVRHVYWLNPEPISDWDIGDSAASEYAACVDKMVEVRNLRQLQEFIASEL
jgi:uncharacterized protein with von Willebrand factor type A (vWA) domain